MKSKRPEGVFYCLSTKCASHDLPWSIFKTRAQNRVCDVCNKKLDLFRPPPRLTQLGHVIGRLDIVHLWLADPLRNCSESSCYRSHSSSYSQASRATVCYRPHSSSFSKASRAMLSSIGTMLLCKGLCYRPHGYFIVHRTMLSSKGLCYHQRFHRVLST